MALFLNESIEALNQPKVSLTEATMDMLDVMSAVSELNESILIADFALHEQSKTLTEAETEEKEGGFITRVISAVLNALKTVKDKIVAMFKAIADAIRNFFNKLTDKAKEKAAETGKQPVVRMSEGGAKAVARIQSEFEALHTAVSDEGAAQSKPGTYSTEISKSEKTFAKTSQQLIKGIKDKQKAGKAEEVPLSQLSILQTVANNMLKIAAEADTRLKKQEETAKKAEKKAQAAVAKAKDPSKKADARAELDDVKREISVVKAVMKGYQTLASNAGKLHTIAIASFAAAGAASAEDDADAAAAAAKEAK
jgi:hypothetical protein